MGIRLITCLIQYAYSKTKYFGIGLIIILHNKSSHQIQNCILHTTNFILTI